MQAAGTPRALNGGGTTPALDHTRTLRSCRHAGARPRPRPPPSAHDAHGRRPVAHGYIRGSKLSVGDVRRCGLSGVETARGLLSNADGAGSRRRTCARGVGGHRRDERPAVAATARPTSPAPGGHLKSQRRVFDAEDACQRWDLQNATVSAILLISMDDILTICV